MAASQSSIHRNTTGGGWGDKVVRTSKRSKKQGKGRNEHVMTEGYEFIDTLPTLEATNFRIVRSKGEIKLSSWAPTSKGTHTETRTPLSWTYVDSRGFRYVGNKTQKWVLKTVNRYFNSGYTVQSWSDIEKLLSTVRSV